MVSKLSRKSIVLSAVAGSLMVGGAAQAATYTWNQTAAGPYGWTNPANWTANSGFPNGSTDVANVTAGIAGNQTISLGEGINISTLNLGATSANGDGVDSYTIGGGGGNVLTLSSTALTYAAGTGGVDAGIITENAGGSGDTITSAVSASGNMVIVNNAANTLAGTSNTLTLSGAVTDSTGNLYYAGVANSTTTLSNGNFSGGDLYANYSNGGVLNLNGTFSFGYVGSAGNGTVNLASGTLTTNNNNVSIGHDGGTAGTLVVSGGTFNAGTGSIYMGNTGSPTDPGTLTVSGNGTFSTTGGFGVADGAINISQNGALQTNGLTVANGGGTGIITQTGGSFTAAHGVTIGNGGTATFNVSGGTFTETAVPQAGTGSYNGILVGFNGTGTMNISGGVVNVGLDDVVIGSGTAGTVNLSGGTLQTNGAVYWGSPYSIYSGSMSGGSATFNFTGGILSVHNFNLVNMNLPAGTSVNTNTSVASPLGTLTNAGGTLAPGGVGTVGTTYITGNYAVSSPAASLAIDISAAGNDLLAMTGSQGPQDGLQLLETANNFTSKGDFELLQPGAGLASLGGSLQVDLLNGFTPGTSNVYTILTSDGLSGAFANAAFDSRLNVTNFGSNSIIGSFDVVQSGNNVELTGFLGAAAVLSWDPAGNQTGSDGSGTWDSGSARWATGSGDLGWVNGHAASIGAGGAGGVITIDSTGVAATGLTFNPVSSPYTVASAGAGDDLALSGIVTMNADATINAPITGNGALTITGAGTLTLGGANTYTGNTTVSSGALELASGGVLTSPNYTVNGGTMQVDAGGSLSGTPNVTLSGGNFVMDAAVTLNALSVGSGSTAQTAATSAHFGNIGSPDVTVNSLSVATGGTLNLNESPMVIKYSNVGGTGSAVLSGVVSGIQAGTITSSAVTANPGTYGIGTLDTGTSVEVMPTLLGDTKLSGSVGPTDYLTVVANYNTTGKTWAQGSFDYSGSVGPSSYLDVVANYNKTLPTAGPVVTATHSSMSTTSSVATPSAGDVTLVVNTATGDVQLRDTSAGGTADPILYDITSASGALVPFPTNRGAVEGNSLTYNDKAGTWADIQNLNTGISEGPKAGSGNVDTNPFNPTSTNWYTEFTSLVPGSSTNYQYDLGNIFTAGDSTENLVFQWSTLVSGSPTTYTGAVEYVGTPEPGTLGLLGLGALTLLPTMRRRRAAKPTLAAGKHQPKGLGW